MKRIVVMMLLFATAVANGQQLTNWKGTPFNEIDSRIKNGGLVAVYILPNIVHIGEANGVWKKKFGTPASMGFIENDEQLLKFKQCFLDSCSESEHPQSIGQELNLVMIVKGDKPLIELRAFIDRGVWYFWYEFRVKDVKGPLVFVKKCDEEFSEFLSERLVKISDLVNTPD